MLEQLSPYEKMRLERIKRNEERMRELGLDKYPLLFSKKKKQTTPPNKKKQPARVVTPGQERRSQRNQKRKKPIESQNDHFSSDDEVDEDDEVDVRRPYRKRRLLLDPVDYRLSSADRAALEGAADENFMGKFQEFLEFHDKISPANVKNVMRQARKLASGEGIRYESPRYGWAPGRYFQKGTPITPMSDFVGLMAKGQECEDKWGRDHGNGWLISHPLKKLLLFQQFVLQHPDFLASDLRLKEYCAEE